MDPSIAASLVGGDFAAASIVIVFHMFTMQRWLDDCQRALDEAVRVSRSTGSASVDRGHARRKCAEVKERFPTFQVIVLGLANLSLCVLAILAGISVQGSIPLYYTAGPALLLLIIQLATTVVYARSGMKVLREALEYLGTAMR